MRAQEDETILLFGFFSHARASVRPLDPSGLIRSWGCGIALDRFMVPPDRRELRPASQAQQHRHRATADGDCSAASSATEQMLSARDRLNLSPESVITFDRNTH